MKGLLLLICLSIILLTPVFAGNEIIDYLSYQMYIDCQGEKEIGFSPYLIYVNNNLSSLSGRKVTPENIKEVVKTIIDNEPYDIELLGMRTSLKSGKQLFYCGSKQLDANFNTYRWNNQRVDPFVYNVQNFESYIDQRVLQYANLNGSYKSQLIQSLGNDNTNTNVQYSLFSDSNLYLTLGLSVVVSLISVSLFEIGLSIWKKRKQRKRTM